MDFIKGYSGVVALVILAILAVSGFLNKSNGFGTTACTGITCLSGGLRITDGGLESDTTITAGTNITLTSGTLTNTTSNTATSTSKFGCIQTTATSTATPIKLVISTAINASTTFTGTANGIFPVFAAFGNCP